ncbi:hypothetical protein FB45DRAFT_1018293 [Roridomyces roridus]|uniref:Uncharacterized protein n=1 Tax=Roridomyces roridus TaxID=1738132 RepID=A0AAD7CK94_9AGAR|nr:hypothetical protein FB45DRAFT_1018293 [Roridomyces roridus]
MQLAVVTSREDVLWLRIAMGYLEDITYLARGKLPRVDVDLNDSDIALPSFVDLANFRIAGLDYRASRRRVHE